MMQIWNSFMETPWNILHWAIEVANIYILHSFTAAFAAKVRLRWTHPGVLCRREANLSVSSILAWQLELQNIYVPMISSSHLCGLSLWGIKV